MVLGKPQLLVKMELMKSSKSQSEKELGRKLKEVVQSVYIFLEVIGVSGKYGRVYSFMLVVLQAKMC